MQTFPNQENAASESRWNNRRYYLQKKTAAQSGDPMV